MGKHADQRDRTLCLMRILYEETDEKHPLPLSALLARLARQGITAERKSIYRDMAALRKHGVHTEYRAGLEGGWYLASRTFTPEELRMVMDAVAVYRCLNPDVRAGLLEKLSSLAPAYQRKALHRPVTLRPGRDEEDLQKNLDRIHTACQTQRALSFQPFLYTIHGNKEPDGPRRMVSPKAVIWAEEGYHLLCWDHRERCTEVFRVDRMSEILVTGMPAQGEELQPEIWTAVPFSLNPHRRERVRLRCRTEFAGEIFNRFGPDTKLEAEPNGFTVTVEVGVGGAFWGWLTEHSEEASVIAPPWAAKLWSERCRPRVSPGSLRGCSDGPLRGQSRAV